MTVTTFNGLNDSGKYYLGVLSHKICCICKKLVHPDFIGGYSRGEIVCERCVENSQ